MMKKLTFASIALLAASNLYAQTAADCTGGDGAGCAIATASTARSGTYTAGVDDAAGFISTDFGLSVSANVGLNSIEDSVGAAVATASAKGRNYYSGSTYGGSVTTCGDPVVGSLTIETVKTPDLAKVAGCEANEAIQ
jgi:hypothetical protein